MCANKVTCNGEAGARPGDAVGKNATITIMNGCFAGLKIKLEKDVTTLGSKIECDICLDHAHVCAEHAVIRRQEDEFVLEDRGSRHGTMLNGGPVNRAILHRGDTISIGAFELEFSR